MLARHLMVYLGTLVKIQPLVHVKKVGVSPPLSKTTQHCSDCQVCHSEYCSLHIKLVHLTRQRQIAQACEDEHADQTRQGFCFTAVLSCMYVFG